MNEHSWAPMKAVGINEPTAFFGVQFSRENTMKNTIHYVAINPDGSVAWDTTSEVVGADADESLATLLNYITWMDNW